MPVVGIDLGTTHSSVGSPDVLRNAGYVVGQVTIITDSYGRKTHPSVVAVGPDGSTIVGYRAKQRMGLQPAPVAFVKRDMGTTKKFRLGERECLPEEVSAEILKYLKNMAEERLGESIQKAVITVPAYFDQLQREATRKAGEIAGLEVVNILQEPVASALVYMVKDPRDPLRIMVYDLGGGTFDVTVIERREGQFQVLAFDGDPFLGGYDFDKAIVNYIVEKLCAQGYKLDFDLENSPEDKANFHNLLFNVAEPAKIALSSGPDTHIRKTSTELFPDKNGEPLVIDLYLTREEFENLIQGEIGDEERPERKTVERTIGLCKRALAKAGVTEEKIDEIIMVGGSSYIPLVQRRLREDFGKEPQLVEPDLAVAVGAALNAREFERVTIPGKGVWLVLDDRYPRTVSSEEVIVSGQVKGDAWQGGKVELEREDGFFKEGQEVSEAGGFLFEAPLRPEDTNQFQLAVRNREGGILVEQTLEVVQTGIPVPGPVPDFNPKPFYIETVDGLWEVCGEATQLPHRKEVLAQTATAGEELHLIFYEEDREIGRIVVPGLQGLPKGTPLEIELEFASGADGFQISGSAYIPLVQKKVEIDIKLTAPEIPSLAQLHREFGEEKARFEEALQTNPDPGARIRLGPEGEKIVQELDRRFGEPQPDAVQICRSLTRLRGVTRKLRRFHSPLTPSGEEFEANVQKAFQLLPRALEKDPSRRDEKLEETIKTLKSQGEEAYERRDQLTWSQVNRRLEEIIAELERIINGGRSPDPCILAIVWKQHLQEKVLELSQEAQRQGKASQFAGELRELQREIDQVRVENLSHAEAVQACQELYRIYHTRYVPLYERICGKRPEPDGDIILPDILF